jgi:hypothetical protein
VIFDNRATLTHIRGAQVLQIASRARGRAEKPRRGNWRLMQSCALIGGGDLLSENGAGWGLEHGNGQLLDEILDGMFDLFLARLRTSR